MLGDRFATVEGDDNSIFRLEIDHIVCDRSVVLLWLKDVQTLLWSNETCANNIKYFDNWNKNGTIKFTSQLRSQKLFSNFRLRSHLSDWSVLILTYFWPIRFLRFEIMLRKNVYNQYWPWPRCCGFKSLQGQDSLSSIHFSTLCKIILIRNPGSSHKAWWI